MTSYGTGHDLPFISSNEHFLKKSYISNLKSYNLIINRKASIFIVSSRVAEINNDEQRRTDDTVLYLLVGKGNLNLNTLIPS